MLYRYATLDPRPTDQARQDNAAVLAAGPVYGLEVTIPALAERCAANLDPQHLDGNVSVAAIEEALTWPLPPAGATLATVRADADSVGSMAVLTLRASGREPAAGALRMVQMIADADKEASGPWPGPQAAATAEDLVGLATPVMHLAADHRRPLAERVDLLAGWLSGDDVVATLLEEYRERALLEAQQAINALDARVVGPVAVVIGSHRLAMSIGYRLAPIVVATNPAYSFAGGPAHCKHTVAKWNTDVVGLAMPTLAQELSAADPAAAASAAWGGSSSIIGSPQGIGSDLTTADVLDIVWAHLEDTLQERATDLSVYADYNDALTAKGEPHNQEDAKLVATEQARTGQLLREVQAAREGTTPEMPRAVVCPQCVAFNGPDMGELQSDGTYLCVRGHQFSGPHVRR